jgi:hypothetical protein
MTIVTNNVFPPIPDRQFDWCAYHERHEECPGRYGWGATEAEALTDLARLDEEAAEAEAAE